MLGCGIRFRYRTRIFCPFLTLRMGPAKLSGIVCSDSAGPASTRPAYRHTAVGRPGNTGTSSGRATSSMSTSGMKSSGVAADDVRNPGTKGSAPAIAVAPANARKFLRLRSAVKCLLCREVMALLLELGLVDLAPCVALGKNVQRRPFARPGFAAPGPSAAETANQRHHRSDD